MNETTDIGSIGVENATVNTSTETQLGINQTAQQFQKAVAEIGIGTRPLTGMFLLAGLTFLLYEYDSSLDLGATIMIPSTFLLGSYGYLPAGSGLIYGLLMAVATLISYGIAKFITR